MLAHEPADPAAQRQAGDAGGRDGTTGDRETVQLGFAIELAPCDAALGPHAAGERIDVDAFHRRKVDHDAAVDSRASGHIVAAATNGHLELKLAGHSDGVRDIGHAAASRDQRRPLVDQTVVHFPGIVVSGVTRLEELTQESRVELSGGIHDVQRHGRVSPSRCPIFVTSPGRDKRIDFSL
jgi:hypothetical protein